MGYLIFIVSGWFIGNSWRINIIKLSEYGFGIGSFIFIAILLALTLGLPVYFYDEYHTSWPIFLYIITTFIGYSQESRFG